MNPIEHLLDLLRDGYKTGVEDRVHANNAATGERKFILYIDPNKYDVVQLIIDFNKFEKTQDKDVIKADLARQLAKQLDEQIPGISERISIDDLAGSMVASLTLGEFADHRTLNGACLINMPEDGTYRPSRIHEDGWKLADNKNETRFYLPHMKPLPGSPEMWRRAIGVHEGEHCHQPALNNDDPDLEMKRFKGEIRSDQAAYKFLIEQGEHAMAQALIDIRVLRAANGDDSHASSLFLGDPDAGEPNMTHLHAAEKFSSYMISAVGNQLNISAFDAEDLRLRDPQNFAKALKEAIADNGIPPLRDMTDDEKHERMAKEMSITREEFENLGPEHLQEIHDLYKRLDSEKQFRIREPDNPHIHKYIDQYLGASERMFHEHTPPRQHPAPIAESTAVVLHVTDEDMKLTAQTQYLDRIYEAIGKELNLTGEEVDTLFSEEPQKYIDTLEKLMAEGKIEMNTTHMLNTDQINLRGAQRFGTSVEKYQNYPPAIRERFEKELEKNGEMESKHPNPHLREEIERYIRETKENLETMKTPAPEEKPAEETPAEKSEVSFNKDGKILIGGMRPAEYFAKYANPPPSENAPALAAQPQQGAPIPA